MWVNTGWDKLSFSHFGHLYPQRRNFQSQNGCRDVLDTVKKLTVKFQLIYQKLVTVLMGCHGSVWCGGICLCVWVRWECFPNSLSENWGGSPYNHAWSWTHFVKRVTLFVSAADRWIGKITQLLKKIIHFILYSLFHYWCCYLKLSVEVRDC